MADEKLVGKVEWIADRIIYVEILGGLHERTMQAIVRAVFELLEKSNYRGQIAILSDLGEKSILENAASSRAVERYLIETDEGKKYLNQMVATAILSHDNVFTRFIVNLISLKTYKPSKIFPKTGDLAADISRAVNYLSAMMPNE